jgi:gluconate 2-dehydrogenase subunit 3-like protein
VKRAAADPTGRRQVLKMLGVLPLAGGFAVSEAQAQSAHERIAKRGALAYAPKFFTPHEWATVRVLADIVIPRDERSGSATDAQVPEFMDFVLMDPLAEPRQRESNQTQMRGGLAWLDRECARRFSGKRFLDASEAERTSVLDGIAYTKDAAPSAATSGLGLSGAPVRPDDRTPVVGAPVDGAGEPEDGSLRLGRASHGIAWFNAFRDLTASGFWSSAMGVKDLEYLGNTMVAEWKGCPPAVLAKLGLTGENA